MEHQDWETRVFRKPKSVGTKVKNPAPTTTERKVSTGNKQNFNTPFSSKKIETTEDFVPSTTSRSLSLALQQERVSRKLTREQLAVMCSLPLKSIEDLERCGSCFNQKVLNKINQILKTKLKN